MAGTLADAQAFRDEVVAAIFAVLQKGQAYTIAGRAYSRADLGELRMLLKDANAAVDQLAATEAHGGIRVRRVVPA